MHVIQNYILNQFNLEIQYIYKVFRATYKKFLTTIDRIDYHPSQQYSNNQTRVKRSEFYTSYGHYHSPTRELTPSENKFLDAFLKALYKYKPYPPYQYLKNEKEQVYLLGFWDGESLQMQEVSLKSKITYIFFRNKTSYRINK